jgi:SAM-dependent methyltransferase
MRLIDSGCGQGCLSLGFAPLVAPGLDVGIDRGEASIAEARPEAEHHGVGNVIFQVADIYDTRFQDASFDVAHFKRVQLRPGNAPALSNVHAIAEFGLARLNDCAFADSVVRRGWISAEQLSGMAAAVEAWRASDSSVVAMAECTAIGWKA